MAIWVVKFPREGYKMSFYFENRHSTELSKIRHHFRKESVSNIKIIKTCAAKLIISNEKSIIF